MPKETVQLTALNSSLFILNSSLITFAALAKNFQPKKGKIFSK
jgi:hypothetical protein